MRKAGIAFLLVIICFMLVGCRTASQVEDQAYVLVMGLDRGENGQIEMSVKIPKVSGGTNDASSGGSGKPDNYMLLSIDAHNYEAALEKLDWASPRNLNLAQIKLIVISQELAYEKECAELVENIAQTERLFTAAKMTVCEGKARDFVEAIQPNIGTRISTDIDAMFDHYSKRGYVPVSSLAEFYYQTESVYSDPMISYAVLDNPSKKQLQLEMESQSAAVLSGTAQELSQTYESDIATRYLGAALFADGQMKGIFTGTETILANLMRNEIKSFRYECGNQSFELVPTRPVYVRVNTAGEQPRITINTKLSYAAQEVLPDEARLYRQLKGDIIGTIRKAQDMGVEPFGFAEVAARSFLTLEKWVEYDWRNRFKDAEIEIKLSFAQSDT